MFARTERLTLRPGWPEDAPALAHAIGHESVVRNLSRASWPYTLAHAEAAIADGYGEPAPRFLMFAHARGGCELVGSVGIGPFGEEPHNLGYWVTPAAWGRGYATEAARAVLALAAVIGIDRVSSGHYVDNPGSGAVLRRLGFAPTGATASIWCAGRDAHVESVEYAIDPRMAA